jgi:integrase
MLNKTQINRLKPTGKIQRHLDSDGLYLEVTASGSKVWRYRFKDFSGAWTMKSVGSFPELSVEQARVLRDELKAQKDYKPITFEIAALEWLEYKGYTSIKNKASIKSRIKTYFLPSLGNLLVSHIKPKDLLPIFKSIESSGHLDLARRMQNIASQIFKYSVQNLYCETNPAQPLQGCTKKPQIRNMSAITEPEAFKRLIKTIDQADLLMPSLHLCLQIAPYVFLRSASIRMAKPEHIDLAKRLWVIPKDKMGREHWIPLTDSMAEILKQALALSDGELVFNGARPNRPLSENTLNMALRSIGFDKQTHVFHGFRSSFSTLAREILRLDNELIELQLGHVQLNKVRAAYDRSQRLEERREMMQKWSDFVDGLK